MTMLAERPTTTFPFPEDTTAPAPAEWRGLERDGVRLLVATPDVVLTGVEAGRGAGGG